MAVTDFPCPEGRQQQDTAELVDLTPTAISYSTLTERMLARKATPSDFPRDDTRGESLLTYVRLSQQRMVCGPRRIHSTSQEFGNLGLCTIAHLPLHRIVVETYSVVLPTVETATYQQAKAYRLGIAVALTHRNMIMAVGYSTFQRNRSASASGVHHNAWCKRSHGRFGS